MTDPIIIPPAKLSEEALAGLIESFIAREGTDYGLQEVSQGTKVTQVRRMLSSGQAVIVFDSETQTCNVLTAEELRRWQSSS